MLFLQPLFFLNAKSAYAQVHDTKIEMDRGARFEAVLCPECGGDRRDFFSPPAQLILKKGMLPDMLYFNDLYVSEKFRAAWEAEGLTGIEAFSPVETVRILGQKTPVSERYYMVIPAVSDAQLDILASGCTSGTSIIRDMDAYREDLYQRSVICKSCGRVRLRMHSGKVWTPDWKYPEKWLFRHEVKNDFCIIENAFNTCGTTFILSDRFVEFVKKHGLTNVYGLTQEELFNIQGDIFKENEFTPIFSDPEVKIMPRKKKEWREAGCADLQCDSGRLVIRDVLDDDETFGVEIHAKAGSWQIYFAEKNDSCIENQCIMLRHKDSACPPSEKLGTITLDSGSFYLRSCGTNQCRELSIKEKLAAMGHAPELKSVNKMAISNRKTIPAVFLRTEAGDGDYEIFVDGAKETSSVKIAPL